MFRRNTNLTPAQRANKAMMNIIARLGGCGLLIYFVVKMLTVPPKERPDPTATLIIGIIFVLAAAVLLFMTVQDLWISYKTGRYKASTYEDQDLAEYLEGRETGSSDGKPEDAKAENEDDEDDKENKE
jgi:hypothetical protein